MPVRRMDAKRVANQAIFRSVNERLSELNEAFAEDLDLDPEVMCECPDLECATPIPVPIADYRRIRKKPTWFVVVPDHVDRQLEDVVETHTEYVIVAVPENLLPA